MKATYLNRKSIWNYFSDFTHPAFFSDPLDLKSHHYCSRLETKLPLAQRIIEENKAQNLYRNLESLFQKSLQAFAEAKRNKRIPQNLPLLEEKKWFIEYLRGEVQQFETSELVEFILNAEFRENYAQYLKCHQEIDHFEIFLYTYLLQALSKRQIMSIFLHFYHNEVLDKEFDLRQFFNCISPEQTYLLFSVLQKEMSSRVQWVAYCEDSLQAMRNSQIKISIPVFPTEIESLALEKLYPREILEVLELESDEKKKRYLIDRVLENYKSWWSSFSQDEIKETHFALLDLLS